MVFLLFSFFLICILNINTKNDIEYKNKTNTKYDDNERIIYIFYVVAKSSRKPELSLSYTYSFNLNDINFILALTVVGGKCERNVEMCLHKILKLSPSVDH